MLTGAEDTRLIVDPLLVGVASTGGTTGGVTGGGVATVVFGEFTAGGMVTEVFVELTVRYPILKTEFPGNYFNFNSTDFSKQIVSVTFLMQCVFS